MAKRSGGRFAILGQVTGIDKLKKKLNQFQAEALRGQVRAVAEGVLLIHSTAVQEINDNRDGTPEIRYGPKRVVVASRPGEPPNTDTGRLVQSIKFDFKNSGLIGRVGTNLKYGAWLEFGTENTAARPWLAPAVLAASKEIAAIFEKELKGAIRDLGTK